MAFGPFGGGVTKGEVSYGIVYPLRAPDPLDGGVSEEMKLVVFGLRGLP